MIVVDTDISKLKEAEEKIENQRNEIKTQRDYALSQRDEITRQKQEIIDSIIYAKRIQNAILPKKTDLDSTLDHYFIYNKPRDIVSGDFYWVSRQQNKKIAAVADCTGHGVPGAFMSLIGVAFLNKIVNEKSITSPAEILNLLRQNLASSLKQSPDDEMHTNDGMDIAIVQIDPGKGKLYFAGAKNPLYVVRQNPENNAEPVFDELPADRMTIGIKEKTNKKFSLTSYGIQKHDMVYLFTDGYADQFGGAGGKRMMKHNMKKIIMKIHLLPLEEQKMQLEKYFEEWRNGQNQVDDVLIMGIRIS